MPISGTFAASIRLSTELLWPQRLHQQQDRQAGVGDIAQPRRLPALVRPPDRSVLQSPHAPLPARLLNPYTRHAAGTGL